MKVVQSGSRPDWQRPVRWLPWSLVLAVAVYLRFWAFGGQIILDDEWHAINKLKSAGYGEILRSFGWADHSIPLTLFYKLLADTVGLDEWGMQLPLALAGLAGVVAFPLLLRAWTTPAERLCAGALLAVSPALVHFSRYARPYALTVLLSVAAAVWFYQWWREGGHARAAGFVTCTALAGWLHPVTLTFTLAAPLWAGLVALRALARERDPRPLGRAVAIGIATVLACAVFLGAPLWHDAAALSGKSGVHYPTPESFLVAWQLIAGTGNLPLALGVLGVTVIGLRRLAARDRTLVGYLALLVLVSCLLTVLSGAMWLHQGIVLMRYLAPALPLALIAAGIGMMACAAYLARRLPPVAELPAQIAAPVVLAAAMYWMGPLPEQYRGVNQFTDHMIYQFDYDTGRSGYRQYLRQVEMPGFYERIREAAGGGDWEVVEAPWRLESHFNPIYKYQREHQLPVKIGFLDGLCADGLYGEYAASDAGLTFRHFVHLTELLEDPGTRRFLVLHREPALEGWRELPPTEPCIEAFRERFGEPWIETGEAVVFRFGRPE